MAEIEDLINNVVNQDFSKAGPMFNDILGDKIASALEQEKLAVTDRIFNGVEATEDEEDTSEEDLEMFSDEELEDFASEEDDYEAEPEENDD